MALQVNWQQQTLAQQQLAQQQPGQQPGELIDAQQMALWELSSGGSQEFRAAVHGAQQPWVKLLHRCCSRTGRLLQQMKENARLKAELLDHPQWQLGVHYEPGTARSGFQDTPW